MAVIIDLLFANLIPRVDNRCIDYSAVQSQKLASFFVLAGHGKMPTYTIV